MKRIVAIGMVVLATAAGAAETVKAPFTSAAQQRSYAIGRNIGMNLKQQDLQLDTEQLLKGMKDALAGQPSLLTDAEMEQTLGALLSAAQRLEQADEAEQSAELRDLHRFALRLSMQARMAGSPSSGPTPSS